MKFVWLGVSALFAVTGIGLFGDGEPGSAVFALAVAAWAVWMGATRERRIAAKRTKAAAATPAAAFAAPSPAAVVQDAPATAYIPSPPAGKPVEPWGKATYYTDVVGEASYGEQISQVMRNHRIDPTGENGAELDDVPVRLAADPRNPFDENAVGVWIDGLLVGFLGRDNAKLYSKVLQDLDEQGLVLLVRGRVWARAGVDYDGSPYFRGSVNLRCPGRRLCSHSMRSPTPRTLSYPGDARFRSPARTSTWMFSAATSLTPTDTSR